MAKLENTSSQASISADNGLIKISGELDFQSVAELLKSLPEMLVANSITVDMSAVTHSNSAALALMLECMKVAQQKNIKINYRKLPDQLQMIVKAYGVDEILPVE